MAVQHPGDGVIRRVGGLEVIPEHPAVQRGVIRRVGGLEVFRRAHHGEAAVIRRVGGKNTEKQPT